MRLMKVWLRSICSEYQTLTPHSDRRTRAISSAATPARSIDADCPRTNVAGGPTIRSYPRSHPSVEPASQTQSAQRVEPSAISTTPVGISSFADHWGSAQEA
jgi:hypothetical protein